MNTERQAVQRQYDSAVRHLAAARRLLLGLAGSDRGPLTERLRQDFARLERAVNGYGQYVLYVRTCAEP